MFKLKLQSKKSKARLGTLATPHGSIQTPFFLPIATKGSVKALTPEDLKSLGAQVVLSNTYHLYLQPGTKVLKKFKGLHNFMNWPGPILTDSGGYQVFSLSAKTRKGKNLRSITKAGVNFHSFLDGSKHLFTPERVQDIQDIIGSDIKMVLDVCSPYPASKAQAELDLNLTHLWAQKSLDYHQKKKRPSLLFGILQGSTYRDLRIKSAQFLSSLDFDGLAIGGLAVGEPDKAMYKVLDYLVDYLPASKPRYLMGVGRPENIVEAVKRGVDMFDCVIPTREARHGRLYVSTNNKLVKNFYNILNINNAQFRSSTKSLDKQCPCQLCRNYSLGYLYHLFKAGEPLAPRLATLHNICFYLELFKTIRFQLKNNRL